ncbi:hypothetical protein [Pararhizobium sp. A13]|uniref:hypothetical protein n=1 Tax=Pararhizobium sp. A13 TaxID=3133975 RepID=UPI0032DBCC59
MIKAKARPSIFSILCIAREAFFLYVRKQMKVSSPKRKQMKPVSPEGKGHATGLEARGRPAPQLRNGKGLSFPEV